MITQKNSTRIFTEATDLKPDLKMQAFLILSLILSPTSSRTPSKENILRRSELCVTLGKRSATGGQMQPLNLNPGVG